MQRRRVQRGSIFLRKGKNQTTWVARYLEPVSDANGQVRMVHKSRVLGVAQTHRTPGLTKRNAQTLLDMILRPLNEDTYTPSTTITFEELYNKWEREMYPNFLRDSTGRFYKDTIHGWILPYFKNAPLVSIRPEDVQHFVNRFANTYSKSTLKHIRAGLNKVFRTAVTWKYLSENPAAGLTLPRGKEVVRAKVFEAAQISSLYSNLESPYHEMVLLIAVTGMRESELFGLKWQDLDADNGVIRIRQRVYRRHAGELKTKMSRREIKVLPEVFGALRHMRGQPEEFVFHGVHGGFMRGDEIMKNHIRPVAERVGLSPITWRSFRRSGESTMHNNGVPLKGQQAVLGHTNPNITMMYAETNDASLTKAAEILGRPFFPILSQEAVTEVVQ